MNLKPLEEAFKITPKGHQSFFLRKPAATSKHRYSHYMNFKGR
jgi:hypothetical protein